MLGLALVAPACQQILGITDPLPLGTGGSSGASSGGVTTGGGAGTAPGGTGGAPIGGTGGTGGGSSGAGGSGGAIVTQGLFTAIWYSPAYANKGRYLWSPASAQPSTFSGVCDFNADGKLDALLHNQTNWSVMLSDGTSFPQLWGLTGFGSSSDRPLVGDVNGDQNCDVALFTPAQGTWTVAKSAKTSLASPAQYITSFGVGSDSQFLADVNGDGRADAIAFFASTGSWHVALSDTASDRFLGDSDWRDGLGAGSTEQMVGDVDGDGRADVVAFTQSTGQWVVGLSTGTSFSAGSTWLTGFGNDGSRALLGDVTGDGCADAVTVRVSVGTWNVAPVNATKNGFDTPRALALEHGVNATAELIGDVAGVHTGALVGVSSDGTWRVLPSGYKRPAAYNTWEARNILYTPLDDKGNALKYDGESGTVIAMHLAQLTAAKIDVALLDLTTYPVTDDEYSKTNALAVCSAVGNAVRVGSATPLYAVAVSATSAQAIEDAATAVWTDFVSSARCGSPDAYFHLDGKPLLVIAAEYADRLAWESWSGSKSASSQFTLRWAQSQMPGAVPPSSYGDYFGFAYPAGPLDDKETMVVAPGYDDHAGTFITRNPGTPGATYQQAWAGAISLKPRMLVIESFNDYVRETAVAPTDTTKVVPPSEPWVNTSSAPDPTFYWSMTVTNNAVRKQ